MECLRLKQDSRSTVEGSMHSFLMHKDIYHYFSVLQIKQQKLVFETDSLWVIELIDQWIQEWNHWKLASNSFLYTKFLQPYMVTQNDKNVVLKNYNQYVVAPSWWLYDIGGVIHTRNCIPRHWNPSVVFFDNLKYVMEAPWHPTSMKRFQAYV